MWVNVLLVIGGAGLLILAADRLVLSAGGLASKLGMSPVLIGAVVIGFGSSAPELVVSLAALDQPNGLDLAVGNIVGSNIANISLVLGFSVLLFPFAGLSKTLRREGVVMMVSLIAVAVFAWNQELTVWSGAALLAGLPITAILVSRWAKSDDSPPPDIDTNGASTGRLVFTAVISIAILIAGARAMVIGAESIALEYGLSEGLVGLTILALGTSLPELGTVLASARRGQAQLVVGNVLGSNIFNSFGVVGTTAVFGAGSLETNFRGDLVVMLMVAVVAGLAAWTGDRYHRYEGALLLLAYPVAIWLAT